MEKYKLPHIGMRKIKSVLAVLVAFFLWQMVRAFLPELEPHPIYMYIYGIIEIRDSSENTVDMGWQRIKATCVALAIGLPMLALANQLSLQIVEEWSRLYLELALILVGTLATLAISQELGCKNFCGLAASIFVILFVSQGEGDPFFYSILRAGQTVAGVFVAWMLNVILLPYPGPGKE